MRGAIICDFHPAAEEPPLTRKIYGSAYSPDCLLKLEGGGWAVGMYIKGEGWESDEGYTYNVKEWALLP
jgi:hypoxanthine phosphoribosyltransferase